MKIEVKEYYADILLRLFLEAEGATAVNAEEFLDVNWDLFLKLAKKNVVLVRSYELIKLKGGFPSEFYRLAVEAEKKRISLAVDLIGKLTAVCTSSGIGFVFPKAFQHYPDMGHDIDLLVSNKSRAIDSAIGCSIDIIPSHDSFFNLAAGKSGYSIKNCETSLEIHHALLGHFGEHRQYPKILMKNREKVVFNGVTTFVPCLEDRLIICALQRMYGHFYLRISDMLQIITLLKSNYFNWDYVIKTTKEMGIVDGLAYLVSYVKDKYESITEKPAVSPRVPLLLTKRKIGKLVFKNNCFYFPMAFTIFPLYLKNFSHGVLKMNFFSLGKLFLMPFLVLNVFFRTMKKKIGL